MKKSGETGHTRNPYKTQDKIHPPRDVFVFFFRAESFQNKEGPYNNQDVGFGKHLVAISP